MPWAVRGPSNLPDNWQIRPSWLTLHMVDQIRVTFARLCRDTRIMLDITQRELASIVGVSRPQITAIEAGRSNPPLGTVQQIAEALGLEVELVARPPQVIALRQRDLVHAWCSAHVGRRLRRAGCETHREVEVVHARSHGWIDLIAFDPRTRTLVIVEIKTRLDDLGAIERQLGWYEREALAVADRYGWVPTRVVTWLLVLATEEVDTAIRLNRGALREAFPVRAPAMRELLDGTAGTLPTDRGLAMIDPASRRVDWLISTRLEGRRSEAPYRDYADAAQRLADPNRRLR